MKSILLTFVFAVAALLVSAEVFVYTGVYQGKDLYVTNPFSSDGVGFCVFEVRVNGEITTDEWNSSAFAVDLSIYGFSTGTPVEVVIRTKNDCSPRLINPEAIAPRSTFEVTAMEVNDAVLRFTTEGEEAAIPFIVEQYKWNKWIAVASVDGKGKSSSARSYSVPVPLHSGMNTFRIAQPDAREMRRSARFELPSKRTEVGLVSDKFTDAIAFTHETDYEVFDVFGRLVTKGYGQRIDATNWKSGMYYLNFDRTFGQSIRKR